MKCPIAVLLLLVSLTSWPVLSDRLPEQVESSKYVQKDEYTKQITRLQDTVSELRVLIEGKKGELTELQYTVGSLSTDLLDTRNLLAQALIKVS